MNSPSSQCSWPSSPGPSAVSLRPRRPPGTPAQDPWCAAAPPPPRWAPGPRCSAQRSGGGGARAAWAAPAGGSGTGRRSWWPTRASPGGRASLARRVSPTSLPLRGGEASVMEPKVFLYFLPTKLYLIIIEAAKAHELLILQANTIYFEKRLLFAPRHWLE